MSRVVPEWCRGGQGVQSAFLSIANAYATQPPATALRPIGYFNNFNTDNRRGMRFIPRAFMPKRTDIHSVLIIGAGPIIIGQASRLPHSAESGLHTHSLVRSSTRTRPVSTALMRLTCRSSAPSSSR